MSREGLVLAVDLGTGGPKVGLVTFAGEIVWQDHIAVETRLLAGGGAVQDAAHWWDVILDAGQRGIAACSARANLVAVSVTGQWASTVPVDSDGVPVGDCVLWMDTRGGPLIRRRIGGPVAGYAPGAIARWVRRTGGAPSTTGADPVGHMLHIEAAEPAVAAAARWYLEPVDYLTMRFTGAVAASHASMTGAFLTDNRQLGLLAYDTDLVQRAGVPEHKLPPLRPTGSVVGQLRPDVAASLGVTGSIDAEVDVVTGTPDLHSAACGAGAVLDFQTHLAISTSSWIGAPVPFKKTDIVHQIASVPGLGLGSGLGPSGYLIANNHETGGLCLQWLRDSIAPGMSFSAFCEEAATAEPGCGGVVFTPWLNGERSPIDDRNARGGFHNLSLSTRRPELVRAVLEGVAYNSRWLHEAVEKFAGRRLDPIRIIGGGAQSDLWCQIHADVMDRTIERVVEPLHANLRGAAIFAGLSLGKFPPAEVGSLVKVEAASVPDPSRRVVYERLYREFPRLYKAQKSMFRRLNKPR